MRRFGRGADGETQIVIEDRGSDVGTFLLGIGIGAGLALLLAPQSGAQTRAIIKRSARSARRHARDAAEELASRVSETFTDARQEVGRRMSGKTVSDDE